MNQKKETGKLVIFTCDGFRQNGETQLARDFHNKLESKFLGWDLLFVTFHEKPCNFVSRLFGDYLRYFWLWWQLLATKLRQPDRGVVVTNYLPIWCFVTFLLAPKETIFAPVTGSVVKLDFCANNKYHKSYVPFRFYSRVYLIYFLSLASRFIIKKRDLKVIAATKSVSKFLGTPITFAPYVWCIRSAFTQKTNGVKDTFLSSNIKTNFVIYTSNHMVKNNAMLRVVVKQLCLMGFHGEVIAPKEVSGLDMPGINRRFRLPQSEFIATLFTTNYVIQLSTEEAGLFAFEASLCGVKVLGFDQTGCSILPGFVSLGDWRNVLDLDKLTHKIAVELRKTVSTREKTAIRRKTEKLHRRVAGHFDAYF